MKPWEYSPKLETTAQPSKLEVIQKTEDLPTPERHHLETIRPWVYLPAILLENLMLWVSRHHELRLECPGVVVLNARPEHVRDAVKAHPWGVVYDAERYLLMSWGDVPSYALTGKNELQPVQTAQVPVTAEKVVN